MAAWHAMDGDGQSASEVMLRDALETIKALDYMLRGNGGPGLAEQVRNNADDVRALRDTVEALTDAQKPDPLAVEVRWRVVGQVAVALMAAVSLALSWLGG